MSNPFQLQFATYTFPNQTFELVDGHKMDIDTPAFDIRRKNGGVTLQGFLKQKKWRINGKVYGSDEGSVHNELNTLLRSMHNGGVGSSFFYLSDRYAFAQLAPGGLVATPEKGLYRFMWGVDIILISDPFSESTTRQVVSGSRTNNSAAQAVTPGGNFDTAGVFTFVGGAGAFSGAIRVDNVATSLFFQFTGGLLAGQTLLVDCVAGSVMRQVGLTMVDAISYFGGSLLNFMLKSGQAQNLIINAPTLTYSLAFRERYYV